MIDANLADNKPIDMVAATSSGTYSDFRIQDDRAYARLTTGDKSQEVRFTRDDGFWYLDG